MSYGNSDGSDGSSNGGYGSDSSSSSSAGGYGGDSSSSSSDGGYGGDSSSSNSGGGYGGDSSSSSSSGSCGDDSSSSSSSGNFGSDSSSSSSNDDSNSNSSGVDSTSDNSDNSDSGSNSDNSNVNSDSSAAAENASSIDSSSLAGTQLDGSAGNSLSPSEGVVGGTPCSDDIGSFNTNTYNGISLDGTAGASLESSEPATAYSFSGYISDSYDSTVASSYQNTMDMSGFQNTEATEPSLLGSAWNSLAQWADQNVVQPIHEALITPLQSAISDTTPNYAAQLDGSAGNMLNPNQVANVTELDNNELSQFSLKPAESLDNLIGTISASTEVTLEGLKAYVSNSLSEMPRPNNIQARVWNNTIQTELAEFSSEVGSLARGAKAVGYAGIGIGVGVDMYDNIQEDAPISKIVSDAVVDTGFGLGGLASSVIGGTFLGSANGVGKTVGGLVGGLAYMAGTELVQPGGKSIKDRAKEGANKQIK